VARRAPGTQVKLTVLHNSQRREVELTLAALKDEVAHGGRTEGPSAGPSEPASGLGIAVGEEDGSVVVERVAPDSPADGKLRPGDVIEEVNHQHVASAKDLAARVQASSSDKPVLLRVKRGDQSRYVAIDRAAAHK
jgi:S1-C subfamily serine protease